MEEKTQFDTSINFERRDTDVNQGWTHPAPSVPTEPELAVETNVLCIRSDESNALAISTANNACNLVSVKPPYAALEHNSFKADSPILSTVFLQKHYTASSCMSGKIIINDTDTGRLVAERRDHLKWAVQVAVHESSTSTLIVTAGWDQKIQIYNITTPLDEMSALNAPVCTLTLSSNPESMVFVTHPDTGVLYLVVSRRDSSFLYYYEVRVDDTPARVSVTGAGKQNLAPHSNAWVAFTPSAMAVHPSDPSLLAIATSHLPHLKIVIVRLLFPSALAASQYALLQTQASVARADLALQDKEDAAIILQVSTQAPQTPYSTPQISWRPNGSGVWVNGDDGVVRGVEMKTGKVVALLKAHEIGSKVRTLWAGHLRGDGDEKREVLVSGGFDRKVFIWEVDDKPSQ